MSASNDSIRRFLRISGAALWLLVVVAFVIVVLPQLRQGQAQEQADGDLPIVLQPSSDPNPPAVQLDPEARNWEPNTIGEFELVDQTGETVNEEDLKGSNWVASFIFTSCAGYCPNLMGKMHELAERLEGTDVRFVTITVDPDRDTPEVLRKYASLYTDDPDRWMFLSGDKEDIYRVVRHGFKVPVSENQGEQRIPGFEVAHSLSLIHVGPDLQVRGKYDSRDDQEVRALRLVLEGKLETPPENRPMPPTIKPQSIEAEQDVEEATSEQPETSLVPDSSDEPAPGVAPGWVMMLPAANASLNGLAGLLLAAGYVAVRKRHLHLHAGLMLTAFAVSMAFLACYLTYHIGLDYYTGESSRRFGGYGIARYVYFGILITHVVLAAAVPVLAIMTLYRALRGRWSGHRRIARITFPIWMYVSVTGVIIYLMLYHWPSGIGPAAAVG